jgi:hypothetical protein
MAGGEHEGPPPWSKYPPWVLYLPGLLGAAWLIGALAWFFFARVLPADTSLLAKGTQTSICLSGIAFAISGLWPVRGQTRLRREDIPDFWAFVRAPSPSAPHLRAVHTKFRMSLGLLLIAALSMVAHVIVVGLGLARPA